MELDVGRGGASGRRTRSRRSRTGWRRPAPSSNSRYCRPAQAVRCSLAYVVVGVVAGAFGDDEQIEMILQVGADAGQVVHRRDADRFQMIGRADARLQQQLRRADGAGRDDHLALGAQDRRLAAGLSTISTPTARPLLDDDAGHQRTGPDGQVLAGADRLQIGDRGGGAPARPSGSAGSSRRLPGCAPLKSGLKGMPISWPARK